MRQFLFGFILFFSVQFAFAQEVERIRPTFQIKSYPEFPVFNNHVNLGFEWSMGQKLTAFAYGGYYYRNELMFELLSTVAPRIALSGLERGYWTGLEIKYWPVVRDSGHFAALRFEYTERSLTREVFNYDHTLINLSDSCFSISQQRRIGSIGFFGGKTFPTKDHKLVFEAFGGLIMRGGIREWQIHDTGSNRDCDPTVTTVISNHRQFVIYPTIQIGYRLGFDFFGKKLAAR